MPSSCKKGEIWRVGYSRSGKKNSKRVSVKGKCIKATSQTGEKSSVRTKKILAEKRKSHKLSKKKYGTPKCKKGQIVREGFKRTSKSGKKTIVAPICVPKKGLGLKREPLFYLEPGRLSQYGYDDVLNRSELARH